MKYFSREEYSAVFIERKVVQFALFNRTNFFSQKSTNSKTQQIKIIE